MFIKNQTFKDEETLLDILFDFSLGEATAFTQELMNKIEQDLAGNTSFNEYRETLQGEDREELDAEERSIRLAENLMGTFELFKVKDRKLYGIKGTEETLLYTIDLV